jgi:YgiT-type zinc finger domain-containing protein
MNAHNDICPVCHGGHRQAGRTTFTVELGFCIVIVRDVPAQVCDLCGSDWLENSVADKLEQIVEQARHREHSLVEIAWQHVI